MQFYALLQLVALSSLFSSAAAHPGEHEIMLSEFELSRRQAAAEDRMNVARNCAGAMKRHHEERKAKRMALNKRQATGAASATAAASTPHVTAITNYTCVTAPEVTEGPYYINNEIVREDLRETQAGLKLILDIGVIDVQTCEPLPDAFVELWNANATGVYGGFPATLSGGGGSPGGGSSAVVRNETFLRGGWYTNDAGIVEITTIYAGYYQGRAPHMHTMVHMDWEEAANGTLISHAGTVSHIGQFFYDETWNDKVFALSPYNTNTNQRTLNSQDSILAQENANGNNAFIDLEQITTSLSGGLYGWVTMGVNPSASYRITSTNYLNSTGHK